VTDPAGRACDQHALASNSAPCRKRAQRSQACDRQRGRVAKLTVSGSTAMRCVGTTARSAQPTRPSTRQYVRQRRTAPVRRFPQHNAANVLAGDPTLLVYCGTTVTPAIERKRLHRDQCVVAARYRLRRLPQFDWAFRWVY